MRGSNPMEELSHIIRRTLRYSHTETAPNNENRTTPSGIRGIEFDSLNPGEVEIISSFSRLLESSFALMPEYRNVVKLIPELQRVLSIVSRDILNRDEFDKRAIKNVYAPASLDKEQVTEINETIDREVIDRYDLEDKLRLWVKQSLIEGAHPVAVFPYEDVMTQLMSVPGARVRTDESGTLLDVDLDPRLASKAIYSEKIFSKESRSLETADWASLEYAQQKAIDDIIGDDIADDFFAEKYRAVEHVIQRAQRESFFSEESAINNDAVDLLRKKLDEKSDDDRRLAMKKNLAPLVEMIDDGVEIVDPNRVAYAIAKKDIAMRSKYKSGDKGLNSANHSPIMELVAPDLAERRSHNKGISGDEDSEELMKKLKKTGLSKEVLLVEYDPELVIPVIIGNRHVGYYVLEYEAYYGADWKARKRVGSFTEMIKGTGFGSDANTTNTVNTMTSDSDPLSSSLFSPIPMYSGSTMMNTMGLVDEDRKNETLKRIALRTIAHRLNDPTLAEDKKFKDAVMSLMRNGYIVNKKIMITYIPAENMVYFAREIDKDGLPVSILDGTLLRCYMYLSSTISSLMIKLMKSADKEKLLINMGMTKQLNFALTEIEKSLSTRNVHVQSLFDNVGTVIRNASTYQRVKIPVVNGEQLYDLQGMERVNDISIDDEFTDKVLQSILLKMGVPPSVLNMLNETEFSRSILMQNLEYRANIVDQQSVYERDVQKMLSLIIRYAGIAYKTTDKADKSKLIEKPIDVKDIKVTFNTPNYLNVANIGEQMSQSEQLVETFTRIFYGDSQDKPLDQEKVRLFRAALYKRHTNSIDWTWFDKQIEQIEIDAPISLLKKQKAIKQDAGIAKAGEDTPDAGGIDESAEGGDESMGGDAGGDNGDGGLPPDDSLGSDGGEGDFGTGDFGGGGGDEDLSGGFT
jgi:hypothetical protein